MGRKIPATGSTVEVRPIADTAEENIEAYKEQAKA